MFGISSRIVGVVGAVVILLTIVVLGHEGAHGVRGSVPLGDDVLVLARGSMPNYAKIRSNGVCCYNSVGAGYCYCPNNIGVCYECKGLTSQSGYFLQGQPQTIQPTERGQHKRREICDS